MLAPLLLCDGVYLVQSRIAMTNIFAVLFQLAARVFLLRAPARAARSVSGTWLAGGAGLGLALSTRWTSLWAVGFLGLTLLACGGCGSRGRASWRSRSWPSWRIPSRCTCCPTCRGCSRADHAARGCRSTPRDIWNYHAGLRAEHPYFSKWYTWPWLFRPTWYHYKQVGRRRDRRDRRARQPGALVGVAAGRVLGPITGLWRTGPAADLLRRGLLLPVPALGAVAADAQLQPLPVRGDPLRLPRARHAARSRVGRRAAARRRESTSCVVIALFLYFLPLLIGYPFPASWFFQNLGGGVRPWSWFRTWI